MANGSMPSTATDTDIPLKVLPVAIWQGPNPLSREPVVAVQLVVSPAMAAGSDEAIAALAKLHANWLVCSAPATGKGGEALAGFLLDWALSALNHVRGFVSERGFRREGPDRFLAWLGFHEAELSLAALQLGATLAGEVLLGRLEPTSAGQRVAQFWRQCSLRHPNSQAEIIAAAARARDIPMLPAWGIRGHWQYGWGSRSGVCYLSASNADGYVAGRVIANKRLTKAAIRALGLPAPDDVAIMDETGIASALDRIGFPCVVKPVDGIGGGGVSAGLNTADDVAAAFRRACETSRGPVMIERYVEGDDFRLLVHRGRLVGAFRRDPPRVVGDGASTVNHLVHALNLGRAMPGRPRPDRLASVVIDGRLDACLAAQHLDQRSIPDAGAVVRLGDIANIEAGGSSTEVTGEVHPDVREAAEILARTLETNLAGFDYITTDISRSWHEVPGQFIELNLTPGLYVSTLAGRAPEDIGALALPVGAGRIPVDCLVVADAASDAIEARLAALPAGEGFGWASPGKANAGGLVLDVQATGPWPGIATLLANRTVERAVIALPAEAIMRHGFPLDRSGSVWIDGAKLPPEWLDVLAAVSASPLREGGLDALLAAGPA